MFQVHAAEELTVVKQVLSHLRDFLRQTLSCSRSLKHAKGSDLKKPV